MKFGNKVAIITGGGAGMGKAAAMGFAREGAHVVICDINKKNMNDTADELKSLGGEIMTTVGDVTNSASINAVVAEVLDRFGKIDILFHYAGGEPKNGKMSPFVEQSEEYWEKIMTLNLMSTLFINRAVLASMIKKRYGKIINTSAIAGRMAAPNMAAYSAAKGGVIAFTRSVATEVAEYGINVNCVCPGPVETPGFKRIFGENGHEGAKNFVPLGRIGQPEDIGNMVMFLASDESSFITGQSIAVDGGITMV